MTHAYEKQLARLLAKPPLRRNDGHTPYTGRVWYFLGDVCAPEEEDVAGVTWLFGPVVVVAVMCAVAGIWEIFGTVPWATLWMCIGAAYALWLGMLGVGRLAMLRQKSLAWIDEKYTILAWHQVGVEYPNGHPTWHGGFKRHGPPSRTTA